MKSDLNYKLTLSENSLLDMSDMFQYGEETFGSNVTVEYRKKLNKVLSNILKMPTIGHRRKGSLGHYLSFNYKSHVIFYLVNEDEKKSTFIEFCTKK
jgi:plasmid stabilization system protein ParE